MTTTKEIDMAMVQKEYFKVSDLAEYAGISERTGNRFLFLRGEFH